MAVYREGYFAVERIQARSQQIWQDACDYGAPVKKGDDLWKTVQQAIEWYGIPGSRKQATYHSGAQVSEIIELQDEWKYSDDRGEGIVRDDSYYVERFRITYIKTNLKHLDPSLCGFFTVEKIK